VVGKDRSFDFETLTRGLRAVESGAVFIGTNEDRKVPTDSGVTTVLVLTGLANREDSLLADEPADHVVDSLDALSTLL